MVVSGTFTTYAAPFAEKETLASDMWIDDVPEPRPVTCPALLNQIVLPALMCALLKLAEMVDTVGVVRFSSCSNPRRDRLWARDADRGRSQFNMNESSWKR